MHFTTSTFVSLLLAASAAAAPQPIKSEVIDPNEKGDTLFHHMLAGNVNNVDKREVIDPNEEGDALINHMLAGDLDTSQLESRQWDAAASVANKLIDVVNDRMKYNAENDEKLIRRWVEGKATEFACIIKEKKVAPAWMTKKLQKHTRELTEAKEGTRVSPKFPRAMTGMDFPAKQDSSDGQHEGDWVELSMAWTPHSEFAGEHVEMSEFTINEIIRIGHEICVAGTPKRTMGFSFIFNSEWVGDIDVTNINDKDADKAYGGGEWDD